MSATVQSPLAIESGLGTVRIVLRAATERLSAAVAPVVAVPATFRPVTEFASRRWVRLTLRAIALGWLVYFWMYLVGVQSTFLEVDAEAYWGLDLATLYQGVHLGDQDAFLYSPAVAFLFAPLSALPYDLFYALLAAANLAALVWLLGPGLAALSLLAVPVSNEIARGNIHLLLAVAIVAGFRYAGAWSWVLLTKVTPGVGLLWFGVRREWRNLGIAVAVTVAIVGATLIVAPELWIRWVQMLAGSAGLTRPSVVEIPVLPRLLVAAAIVAFAARRNIPALVPVAALLALPAIWVNSLAMLVAIIPLWRLSHQRRQALDAVHMTDEVAGELVPVVMSHEPVRFPVPADSRMSIRK